MTLLQTSFFEKIIGKPRPLWVKGIVGIIMLLLPFALALLDGVLGESFRKGYWRGLILPPVIILYIWIISPFMKRTENEVLRRFRPLVLMDDERFFRLVNKANWIKPSREWAAFIFGAVLGLITANISGLEAGFSWVKIYWIVFIALLYGLLFWIIYGSIASTRLTVTLHRQPLRVDLFNLEAFDIIGKQSLLLALVFIGGITLSILLSFQWEALGSPIFWSVYLLLALTTLSIFFLNMYPSHQVLAREKKVELERVRKCIQQSCRALIQRVDENQKTQSLATTINALAIYEQRLLAARTWPYNTTMLRTLFFSVLVPLGTVLARLIEEMAFP